MLPHPLANAVTWSEGGCGLYGSREHGAVCDGCRVPMMIDQLRQTTSWVYPSAGRDSRQRQRMEILWQSVRTLMTGWRPVVLRKSHEPSYGQLALVEEPHETRRCGKEA